MTSEDVLQKYSFDDFSEWELQDIQIEIENHAQDIHNTLTPDQKDYCRYLYALGKERGIEGMRHPNVSPNRRAYKYGFIRFALDRTNQAIRSLGRSSKILNVISAAIERIRGLDDEKNEDEPQPSQEDGFSLKLPEE